MNYDTGEVFPEYRQWLEDFLSQVGSYGHTVFSALQADDYKINDLSPAEAFRLDEAEIDKADALLAVVTDKVSAGVQSEIGMAIAKSKLVTIAHLPEHKLEYINQAIIKAGRASELILPLQADPFK